MNSSRKFFHIGVLAAAACLAGCGPTLTPKEPHVAYETVSHPVLFPGNYTRMSYNEEDSLGAFTGTFPVAAVQNATLATGDMGVASLAHARDIRNYLVARGIDKNVIRVRPMQGLDSHTVVLTVTFAKGVSPAPCPDWSKNSVFDYNSAGGSNFGCAYGSNFIQQLDDPADYDAGSGEHGSVGARDSVYLQKYMAGTPSGGGGGSAGGSSTTTSTSSP